MNYKSCTGVFAACLLAASAWVYAADEENPPNILLILLDDAGYGDVSGFVHRPQQDEQTTPNLLTLAERGARFSRFYADSTCRPARLSLMTGKQASRVATAPDFLGLSPEVETLPEQLRSAGYSTHHVGKWHLGDTTRAAWPSAQGFDHWFGFLNQFLLRGPDDKKTYRRPTYEDPWLQRDDGPPEPFHGHVEDILVGEVIKKIRTLKKSGQPWFINYWTFAPHNPAIPAERYRVKYPEGTEGQYLALMEQLDDNIGKIMLALEATQQHKNTLVIVLSDNGGTNELMPNNGPYMGHKGVYSEGSTRTPMIIYWPDEIPANTQHDGIATLYDIYPTLLSVAGIEQAPDDLDGVNLMPLLQQNKPRPPRTLFWETATNYVYQYSVLSADGRWRLDNEQLFDLHLDPYAKMDVAEPQQKVYQNLKQQFLQWRREAHRLDLSQEKLSRQGARVITGDSFRRAPGFGGFTMVTSLTPSARQPAAGMIAEQPSMWAMWLTHDSNNNNYRIHLQMHDQNLITEPFKLDDCAPLVLSTYYSRSKLQPQHDVGIWFVMLGDRQILVEQRAKPTLFPERYEQATYFGQRADGSERFTGTLESPHFYNEFYYLHDPWKVERDPHWLTEEFCRKAGS